MRRVGYLFAWPSRHNVHIALPLLLVVSFVIHALGVVLFAITYPKPAAVSARSAQVFFLKPGSREAALVQPMLSALDPALFSPAQSFERDRRDLPSTAYVASFDAQRPSLALLPEEKAVPSKKPEFYFRQKSVHPVPPAPPAAKPTRLELEGDLAGRSFAVPAQVRFVASARQNLMPSEYLVAISPEGLPLHVIPQATSGDEQIDRTALAYLLGTRFDPSPGGGAAWGRVIFQWGSDVTLPSPP